jgi:hypothetical protein
MNDRLHVIDTAGTRPDSAPLSQAKDMVRPSDRVYNLFTTIRPSTTLTGNEAMIVQGSTSDMTRTRVVSLDFWRGLALATIFINHVPGNLFEAWTHKNFGFSDAAEAFVLLAGMAAAMAYGPALANHTGRGILQVLMRAWRLYMAHLLLIVVCGAIVCFAVLATNDVRILEATQFDQIVYNPIEAFVGMATLGLQPAYMNILPLYVALLLLAPGLLFLATWRPVAALSASAALYVATQVFDLSPPSYPSKDAWYFNPLAWQFLFAIGLWAGARLRRGEGVPIRRWAVAAAGAYLLMAAVWAWSGFNNPYDLSPVPRFLWDFDKSHLSAPRLLHILALAYVIGSLRLELPLRRSGWITPVIAMGRHSLPVFCLGMALSIAAQVTRSSGSGQMAIDMIIIPAGLLLQLALAWTLEWYRQVPRAATAKAERQSQPA